MRGLSLFSISHGSISSSMPHLPVTTLFKRLQKPLEANGEYAIILCPSVCKHQRPLGWFSFLPQSWCFPADSGEPSEYTLQDFANRWPLDSWCQRADLPHCAWLSPDTRPGTFRLSFPQLEPLIYWPVNSRLVWNVLSTDELISFLSVWALWVCDKVSLRIDVYSFPIIWNSGCPA